MIKFVSVCVVVLGLFAVTGQTNASIITYSTRSAFDSVVSGQNTIDFETPSIVPGFYDFYGMTTGSTFDGATFTSEDNRLFVLSPEHYGLPSSVTNYLNMNAATPSLQLQATFVNPLTYAIGMDLGSLANWGPTGPVQITLSTGDTFSVNIPNDIVSNHHPLIFLGIVSDTPFSSIIFTDPSQSLMVDNFSFSSVPSAVPEPSSLALAGLGGIGLIVGTIRRRRAAAV